MINSISILIQRTALFLFCMLYAINGQAQFYQAERDSISQYAYLDYQEMKRQLGITVASRPGPSGDPNAPNAANTEEASVKPYVLPDPLVTNGGAKVKKAKDWWETRRPEIVEDFEREMYGRLPDNLPQVTWTIKAVKDTVIGSYPVREKTLAGVVDNAIYPAINVTIELVIGTPANTVQPVPVVMQFGFVRWPFGSEPPEPDYFMSPYEPRWQQQLLSQGWGYAILVPSSIQADHGAGLRTGIIGMVNKGEPRKPEQWGALRAWAWGASKAIDYFETDPAIDTAKIGIEGISRYGKAAMVAMAFEPRISLGFIGSAGAGGSALLRRNFGEQIENLASSGEYHWFCGNFIQYASALHVEDLPVDAHQLIALCAPRPVFISSGSPFIEGQWVDAKGMFLAGVHAGPVYELLGRKALGTDKFPFMGEALTNGEIAFRQHAGGHSTGPNWSTWIAWASRYWK